MCVPSCCACSTAKDCPPNPCRLAISSTANFVSACLEVISNVNISTLPELESWSRSPATVIVFCIFILFRCKSLALLRAWVTQSFWELCNRILCRQHFRGQISIYGREFLSRIYLRRMPKTCLFSLGLRQCCLSPENSWFPLELQSRAAWISNLLTIRILLFVLMESFYS
jgi:hypothetical protein